MSDNMIIAVTGATGSQGGGAARAILADPDSGFTVRALTRNPDSAAARELAELGAEVVQADFYDEASVFKAFEGAYGAFLVTNFWAHGSAEKRDRGDQRPSAGRQGHFRTLDIPAADEIGNMFQDYGDFDQEFTGARDLNKVREINPALKSFDAWLADNVSTLKKS